MDSVLDHQLGRNKFWTAKFDIHVGLGAYPTHLFVWTFGHLFSLPSVKQIMQPASSLVEKQLAILNMATPHQIEVSFQDAVGKKIFAGQNWPVRLHQVAGQAIQQHELEI